MREMTMETFYIINQIPKINRAHRNLPWMSCILKFRSSLRKGARDEALKVMLHGTIFSATQRCYVGTML